jgi:adenosylcobyric acid synthase
MKALGVLGTGSSAGKSSMTTALCAWLRGQGVRVAPFKAQNMSRPMSTSTRCGVIWGFDAAANSHWSPSHT